MPVFVAAILSSRGKGKGQQSPRQVVEMSSHHVGEGRAAPGIISGFSTPGPGSPPGDGRETPHGVEQDFKRRRSFNSRRRDVDQITKKHPHKVPIVIERAKSEKNLALLDKSKFLVPEELTMGQLNTIIRRRLDLQESQAFYLIVNRRTMASQSLTLAEVCRTDKDSDGFLYITYASQEMFG